jgi:hypothetical protein
MVLPERNDPIITENDQLNLAVRETQIMDELEDMYRVQNEVEHLQQAN